MRAARDRCGPRVEGGTSIRMSTFLSSAPAPPIRTQLRTSGRSSIGCSAGLGGRPRSSSPRTMPLMRWTSASMWSTNSAVDGSGIRERSRDRYPRIPPSGFPTSWATPAASRPTVASRSAATNSACARASRSFASRQVPELLPRHGLLARERVGAAPEGRADARKQRATSARVEGEVESKLAHLLDGRFGLLQRPPQREVQDREAGNPDQQQVEQEVGRQDGATPGEQRGLDRAGRNEAPGQLDPPQHDGGEGEPDCRHREGRQEEREARQTQGHAGESSAPKIHPRVRGRTDASHGPSRRISSPASASQGP